MLDKKSYIPLYHQLADELRKKMTGQRYKAGRALPSESTLCTRYGISRGTVREALRVLLREGLIERQRGLGTFVASTKIVHEAGTVMSFSRVMDASGKKPSAHVLEFRCYPAPDYIRSKLQLRPGAEIVYMQRLRFGDNEPILLEHSYFRLEIGEKLQDLDLNGPIYNMLEEKYHYVFLRTEYAIEAALAGKNEGRLLTIGAGQPVLIMNRLVYLKDGMPVEYAEDVYRADRTRFKFSEPLFKEQM